MKLNELKPAPGSRKNRKRVGRGDGSGHGTYSCRGLKGQRSRSGGKSQMPGFEGGQTPFWKKLPKRGFNNFTTKNYSWINIKTLEHYFNDGDEVTPEVLKERKIVKQFRDGLKVLGEGELSKKLTVHAHKFTGSAKQKIEAAGGQSVLLVAEDASESDAKPQPKAEAQAEEAPADEAPAEDTEENSEG